MDLPDSEREMIKDAYGKGADLIRQWGREFDWEPESFETVLSIERHRWCWRPEQVRLILVAESHVYTPCKERELLIEDCPELASLESTQIPREYVKLVYCLAYGERELLRSRGGEFRSSGTIQYWDLFGKLTGRKKQPRRSESSMRARLEWKIGTLKELRNRGIWLLDSSLHAIYRTRMKNPIRRIPGV